MKTRISLLLLLLSMAGTQALKAQVKGISYTLSPSIEYSNWGDDTGLSDGYSVGGQLGFGFGQFVELRANYLQSINLQRDFSNFDFNNFNNSLLAEQDVTVTRYGGELKLNLAKGGIVPFLTAGTGIQNIERSLMADSSSSRKNIFFSGGGGLQFSLGDRYTLALQAVNTSFNGSPVRNLIDELEQAEIGVDGANFENVAINNWSYRASILLYLGGRRPGEMTDADKAYVENFSNDFRGLSLPIEITAGQINFGDGLPYADTKFTGVSSGFNFGPYVGIRAFYLRSMDDGYFSNFNRLALYGGEGKFKLSTGQGIAPYLNVGGGVIDPLSGFVFDGTTNDDAENTPFVSGGVGLDLPISRYFKLSGYAKALLTSNDVAAENIDPDELTTSMMYGISADFIIGARSKEARSIDNNNNETYDDMVEKSMEEEKGKADKLKKDYQARIDKLDKEIDEAYEKGNLEKMEQKYQERESAQRFVNRINEIEKKEAEANKKTNTKEMNPSEFRKMMEELQKSQEKSQEQINNRLDAIEKSLNGNANKTSNNQNADRQNMSERERELQKEIDDLRKQARKTENNAQNEVSDREKELQKEIDDLRKQARKTGNNAQNEVSEREKELQKEIDDLRKQTHRAESNAQNEVSDREKELQEEIDNLRKQARKTGNNAQNEVSDREKELQEEIDDLRKQARKTENYAQNEVSDREKELQEEIDDLRKQARKTGNDTQSEVSDREKELKNQIDELRKQNKKAVNNVEDAVSEREKKLQNEIDELKKNNKSLRNENNDIDSDTDFSANDTDETSDNNEQLLSAVAGGSMAASTGSSVNSSMVFLTESQLEYNSKNLPDSSFFSRFNYDGASVIGGFNIGGSTTLNLGVRSHYRYRESNIYVMPEAFFGFGNPASFGLFANGVYQLRLKNENFSPYAGVGVGVLNIGDELDNRTKLAANIVLGTYLFKVAGGRFYVDLSARNFFKYNQLVAGYRLPF